MEIKSFVATMGVGMVAGATVVMMLPKRSKVRVMANRAARSVENAVHKTADHLLH